MSENPLLKPFTFQSRGNERKWEEACSCPVEISESYGCGCRAHILRCQLHPAGIGYEIRFTRAGGLFSGLLIYMRICYFLRLKVFGLLKLLLKYASEMVDGTVIPLFKPLLQQ